MKVPGSTNKHMKFGQLITRKISKIIATGCHILRLKCTKLDSGWGSTPNPAAGAYSARQSAYTGWPKEGKPLSTIIITSYLKITSTTTFLINFEYKMNTRMLLVCIKYSMCDLICDVISCYV